MAKPCRAATIAACRREHIITPHFARWANPDGKTWAYETTCPECGHGGFSVTAPDQTPAARAYRHIWHCNCLRCQCDRTDVREALLSLGIPRSCLGMFGRQPARAAGRDANAVPWPDIDKVLRDPSIRALADFKIRLREARFGAAPSDWEGFLAFAAEAGVPQSGRYEAAARMGRRRPQR